MFWQWNKVRLAFLFPVFLGLTGLLTGCTGKNEIEIRNLSAGGETSVTGGSSSDREDSSIMGKGEGFLPGYGSREDGGQSVGSASSQEAGGSAQQEKSGEGSPATSQVRIKVFVCGAVSQEGVYELESASRVIDAVQAAGGFSGNADSRYVNQAAPLTDGMKLCIPTKAETAKMRAGKESAAPAEDQTMIPARQESRIADLQTAGTDETHPQPFAEGSGKVNLNTASRQELCTLPGIGETKADAILAYRSAHGSFSRIEEIKKIPGIKDKLFLKIKSKISV
ncbi:MAG: helix-hairpin-helix domain-containing protein [Lachnospiraceae bacterium]|nr:helix-hairpin-helix domain-containing protein [Lachnospiraceae bacterium]